MTRLQQTAAALAATALTFALPGAAAARIDPATGGGESLADAPGAAPVIGLLGLLGLVFLVMVVSDGDDGEDVPTSP